MFALLTAIVLALFCAAPVTAHAQIVLSEIMFNPAGSERYDEFIELYNLSAADTTDLSGWLISDSTGDNRITALAASGLPTAIESGSAAFAASWQRGARLAPRSYALLLVPGYFTASALYNDRIPDSALVLTIDKAQFGSLGLNNSRPERISLFTPDGLRIDSHTYRVPHAEGLSAERVRLEAEESADNWRESVVLHGTPGFANSVRPEPLDSARAEMVISEVMANPALGEAEWVECYNAGDRPLRLTGWRLSDADTSRKRLLLQAELEIGPGEYLVLTGEEELLAQLPLEKCHGLVMSDWPGLSSSEDGVVLYDGLGRVVDALWYTGEWGGGRGISLERLSPLVPASVRSNWGSCAAAAGHTAGGANSLLTGVLPAETAMELTPNPFSPDGDGFEDHLAISWKLPAATARVNLRIFDSRGRQVRFLCNYEPSGSRKTLFWDGLDDTGYRCAIGVYILYLEAYAEASEAFMRCKKACVLAGRL